MSSPRTYTHTWTQTRLEAIQDQFRYLLMYANVDESYIDEVIVAIEEKAVNSIGVYGCDSSGLRVGTTTNRQRCEWPAGGSRKPSAREI